MAAIYCDKHGVELILFVYHKSKAFLLPKISPDDWIIIRILSKEEILNDIFLRKKDWNNLRNLSIKEISETIHEKKTAVCMSCFEYFFGDTLGNLNFDVENRY